MTSEEEGPEQTGVRGSTADPSGDERAVDRRERLEAAKHEKKRRIVHVAAALFAERGYASVTTQEIADAADIGAGTLFRYVASKGELLTLVMNEELRLGTDRGVELALAGEPPTVSVLALIAPFVDTARGHPENTLAYQRETIFGIDGPHRTQAIQRMRDFETAVRRILHVYADGARIRPGADIDEVAHLVSSVVFMDVLRWMAFTPSESVPDGDIAQRVRRSVDLLVHGLLDDA